MIQEKKTQKYSQLIKEIFPFIETQEELLVFTQVVSALLIDGKIDEKKLSLENADLIKKIQESILNSPQKRKEAQIIARKLNS